MPLELVKLTGKPISVEPIRAKVGPKRIYLIPVVGDENANAVYAVLPPLTQGQRDALQVGLELRGYTVEFVVLS